ncbi:MAG: hypothetical protein EOP85_06580, partial [Verrucomicrobiaceae bacterium]
MTPVGKRATAAALVAVAGVVLWYSPGHSPSIVSASSPAVPTRQSKPDLVNERDSAETAVRRKMTDDWDKLLEWIRSTPSPSPEEIRLRLIQIRKDWSEIDPTVRAEMISRLLDSGQDAGTGLEFRVGVHG